MDAAQPGAPSPDTVFSAGLLDSSSQATESQPVAVGGTLPADPLPRYPSVYRPEVGDRIAALYQEGKTWAGISRELEIPYHQLCKWRRDHEDFRVMLKGAQADRGMALADEALDMARSMPAKDDVPAARLLVDTCLRLAEADDPARYGKKTTVSGDPDRPVTFIIKTGFSEPNQFQTPPKLGKDGLINQVTSVVSEVVSVQEDTPTIGDEP